MNTEGGFTIHGNGGYVLEKPITLEEATNKYGEINVSVSVFCDWANTSEEQEVLKEITWKLHYLQKITGGKISVEIKKEKQ